MGAEMTVSENVDRWTDRFEGLSSLARSDQERLLNGSRFLELPKGSRIFGPGESPEALLLLLDGTIRVQQLSATGREVTLYRVSAGESCVMTTTCLLALENYSAEGIAETDVRGVAVPKALFDDLLSNSADFREFVFSTYSRRITDLFMLIDDIVFRRLDVRLADRLLESTSDDVLRVTHQMLAGDLGTAREVVSRTLNDFQKRGWIEQARGEIRIVSRDGLERLAAS
jgi:CRP/FNR family transcriptional regulator